MTDKDDSKVEVTSYNQSGGITAQNVTINNISKIPSPTLQGKVIYLNQPNEGKFRTRIELSLISPYPVGNLYIEVRAQTIEEMDCMPMRAGGWMEGMSGKRDGYAFTNLQNAFGNYEVHVITSKAENLQLIYNIE